MAKTKKKVAQESSPLKEFSKRIKKLNLVGFFRTKRAILIPIATFLVPILFFAFAGNTGVARTILGAFDRRTLSPTEIEEFTKDFIAAEVLPNQEIEITNIKDLGFIYSFDITIPNQGTFTSYATKDGSLIFPTGYDTAAFRGEASPEETAPRETAPREIPKSDRPQVQIFLMSFCPFANQAEEIMLPVAELLQDRADIIPRYIVSRTDTGYTSLRGEQEVNQAVRELCVYKYQPEKFWNFLKEVNADCSDTNADTCWTGPAQRLRINVARISRCEREEFATLLDQQIAFAEQYSVSGSPTILINDTVYSGERSAQAFSQAICSAFNTPPQECDQRLEDETQAVQGGC